MMMSVVFAAVWVLAATIVAFLPMRHQYFPGLVLLVAMPLVIVYLGFDLGWIAGLVAVAGFISLFRNPLRHVWRKWRGQKVEAPR